MYAYNLSGAAVTEKINVARPYEPVKVNNSNTADSPYAYLFNYQSPKDVEFLAALLKKKIKVRSSNQPFTVGGQTSTRVPSSSPLQRSVLASIHRSSLANMMGRRSILLPPVC